MTIITKGMGAIYKSAQIKNLRNKALAVLGLGTAGAVGAGAVGSVISSQRKNRKRK